MPLRKIITQASVTKALKALPPTKSFIVDRFYDRKSSHYSPIIGIDEIAEVVKAVPVVRRGSDPVVIGQGSGTRTFIEGQPVEVVMTVPASTVNDLVAAGVETQESFVASRVDHTRRTVRATTEAMAAQSLSGKISWPMKTDGGLQLYEVDFGTPDTITPAKLLDAADVKLMHVTDLLRRIGEKIQENGYGSTVKHDVGVSAFAYLTNLITSLPNDNRIDARVSGDVIRLGNAELVMNGARYWDPKAKAYKYAVDPKKIISWDADAGWELKYLAIDNFDAKFAPTPLYLTPRQERKEWHIYGESKPLPIPAVKSMVHTTVLS